MEDPDHFGSWFSFSVYISSSFAKVQLLWSVLVSQINGIDIQFRQLRDDFRCLWEAS